MGVAAQRLDSRKEYANARVTRVYYALYHFVVARFVEHKKLPSDTIPGAWEWHHSTVASRVWECFADPEQGIRAEATYRTIHMRRLKADYGPGIVSMEAAESDYRLAKRLLHNLGAPL